LTRYAIEDGYSDSSFTEKPLYPFISSRIATVSTRNTNINSTSSSVEWQFDFLVGVVYERKIDYLIDYLNDTPFSLIGNLPKLPNLANTLREILAYIHHGLQYNIYPNNSLRQFIHDVVFSEKIPIAQFNKLIHMPLYNSVDTLLAYSRVESGINVDSSYYVLPMVIISRMIDDKNFYRKKHFFTIFIEKYYPYTMYINSSYNSDNVYVPQDTAKIEREQFNALCYLLANPYKTYNENNMSIDYGIDRILEICFLGFNKIKRDDSIDFQSAIQKLKSDFCTEYGSSVAIIPDYKKCIYEYINQYMALRSPENKGGKKQRIFTKKKNTNRRTNRKPLSKKREKG